MKKKVNFIILLLIGNICNSQNLVPNSSFEVHDTCPNNLFEVKYLANWNIPLHFTTPDYFNACDTFTPHIYPHNFFGDETARSGSGYVGIITVCNTTNSVVRNYREYIQVELNDSLVAGMNYYVSWYVSAGDSCPYISNNMGMYFSNVEVHDTSINNYSVLSYIPQFENPMTNDLNSRIGWTKISGQYLASGGEKFIIIGNFHDTISTVFTISGWSQLPPLIGRYWAYYYIDDVCIATDSMYCNSSMSLNDINSSPLFDLFPNPFNDYLYIMINNNENCEIILYDILSRRILQQKFINTISLSTEQLAKGIYIYEVRNKNCVIKQGKIVKE